MTTKDKISALRALMAKEDIKAYVIPSTDPHMSEYVADFWESRKWISGFTGSAGTVVVTENEAGLWTDGRYFLQAEKQLDSSIFKLFKQGLKETPEIDAWLKSILNKGDKVGVDSRVYSIEEFEKLEKSLSSKEIILDGSNDFIKLVWEDRPALPSTDAYILDEKFTGKSIKDKINSIRDIYRSKGADTHLVASLDDIAWILNLRGSDVAYNPVSISYLLIEEDNSTLFIKEAKVSDEAKAILAENDVNLKSYKALESYLKNGVEKSICLVDPKRVNKKALGWIETKNQAIRDTNPSTLLKASKNKTEIKNFKNAMVKDGVAMVKFLHWLDNNVAQGEITEVGISDKLLELRSQQKDFVGESFSTIAGYKGNGAIIHYSANEESNKTLKAEGLVLVDSGAQYLDGTTDLTRTIALGELTDEEKTDYTLVLRGHIQLALAKFPEGTRGNQLDTLARQPLLRAARNYMHGTGHGVGFFMNVHEGPHSIRPDENPFVLQEGSVSSNEPGMYRSGKHGIRIENLIVCQPFEENEFGKFFQFETITYCPIDTRPIEKELMIQEEIDWLNDYHNTVFTLLSPKLKGEELEWLKNACKAI